MAVSKSFSLTTLATGLFLLLVIAGCNNNKVSLHWSEFVPGTVPYIIIPDEGTTIQEMLNEPYIPFFDDTSPSAIQLIGTLGEQSSALEIEAMLLFTDTSTDWQPVWIAESVSGLMDNLTREYRKQFEQNDYQFNGHTVEKLFISDRIYFAAEASGWLLFSESSLGIEQMLRSINNVTDFKQNSDPTSDSKAPGVVTLSSEQISPGSFILNTKSLTHWLQQLIQVIYRPGLDNAFDGAKPVSFQLNEQPGENQAWQLKGGMEVSEDSSPLIRSISSEPAEFLLDRYIPIHSAAFSIQRLEPRMVPPDNFEPNEETDLYIEQNISLWRDIASQLGSEFAFATFAESGAASTSEYLYLRKINSSTEIRAALNELVREGLASRDGTTYSIQSDWLGKLFGSELNPMNSFYITIYNQVAAVAQRKGLAESIGNEASRRRVMFYDDNYMDTRNSLEGPLSSILYVNSSRFGQYIQPWLSPQNYLDELLAQLNHLVITTKAQPAQPAKIDIDITSFQRETADQPYNEQWVFPLNGAAITGKPVLQNISGNSRNEVVFSTENGLVYGLASDGTEVLQVSTGNDEPVGSPVVYDWYGNNENVIMQAAGNKIYAWNGTGNPLPNFPIQLEETITTPLIVMDITQNGLAEIIVATADRNMHILNTRGQPLSGWPQSTNSLISSEPLIAEIGGQQSIFAFSENTLHAWNVNGSRRNGFPVFMNSPMHGTPVKFRNHLLGAGLDGSLYATGSEGIFADTLSAGTSDSLQVSSLQVSNSSLNATPTVHNLLMRDDVTGFYRDDFILLQSRDGSVFLYNADGELKFTQSLGQPASGRFAPEITDIDTNDRQDVIALANFGRLYAWDLISQQRLYDLPTTGMSHLVIEDLFGNGKKEIIAQTKDGLRCWTVLRTRTEE